LKKRNTTLSRKRFFKKLFTHYRNIFRKWVLNFLGVRADLLFIK